MERIAIDSERIRWARERAGREQSELTRRFKKLPEWEEAGTAYPTLKQAEDFARAVHLPFGYLFLSESPDEQVPVQDFRRIAGEPAPRPSPDLLDTIYACQERQAWYRDFAQNAQHTCLEFVGSTTMRTSPKTVAAQMREVLGFELSIYRRCSTLDEALRYFVRCADEAGVLVMISGVVGNNNSRRLDPVEFRGFALSDELAPLIFVNGADARAAHIFTLAHELAHLWLGESALNNLTSLPKHGGRSAETWCNAVAAELLVPLAEFKNGLGAELKAMLNDEETRSAALFRLAKFFKVSNPVILLRLLDAGLLDRKDFDMTWRQETERYGDPSQVKEDKGGGNFYRTAITRVSGRFVRAVVESTLEGHTLYRDAFRMLGVSKTKTFNKFGREFGLIE